MPTHLFLDAFLMRLLSFLALPNPIKTSLFHHHHHHFFPVSSPSLPFSRIRFPSPISSSSSSSSSSKPTSFLSSMHTSSSNAEGLLATKFWIKFRRESVFSMYTPFVVSLASGTLEIDSFRHYIAQDSHFLKAFAHAYKLAEECADDDDAKVAIAQLRKGVLEELKMHDSFVKEWGIDPGKDGTINAATTKYTDFVLATASGKVEGVKGAGKLTTPFERTKIAAYTLGAMTPCMRLYAFLGKELQVLLNSNDNDHPYKKWIDSYSSENFQASALQTEDLLDKLSVSLTGEELDIIEKLYHQAIKLEIDFFLAQSPAQSVVVPLANGLNPTKDRLVIFSDFDLTCSVVDSCAILAEIAIVTAPKSDQDQSENQIARMPSAELRNTWNLLSGQYTEEFEQSIDSILPPEKVKFSYDILHKALEKLSDFEQRANSRVVESGVLKGLNLEDIKRAGERMSLQDGCTSFLRNIVKSEELDTKVHVLSYCWCADLIRSAFSSGDLNVLNVHANELTFIESISTGEIVMNVESPVDKVQAFHNMLSDNSKERTNFTVYIGDSIGDLLCLLQADIGIVIGSSSSLRKVGSEFGVSFVPLFPGVVDKQKDCTEGSCSNWKSSSGTLYTASSWAEIHAFILGW